MSRVTNIVVALSNLVAIPFMIGIDLGSPYALMVLLPMIASMAYHLGEKKHGLPGIYPFNTMTDALLWVDRLFAFTSALFMFSVFCNNPYIATLKIWSIIIVALLYLWISERDAFYITVYKRNPAVYVGEIEFLIFHCIWHILAFYLLTYFIKAI
jgi:hypothetical protein